MRVNIPTPPVDARALSERDRLWRDQLLFSAVQAAGTIGLVWLSATAGGGPVAAALIIAAALIPVFVGAAPAALLVARMSRRHLLWGSQAVAAIALIAAGLCAPGAGLAPLAIAALATGAARAIFDAAAADVLQQLVHNRRTHDAMGDLTLRFGLGQALGLTLLLGAGFAAGPTGAVLAAGALGGTSALLALQHRAEIDLRPAGAVPLHGAMRQSLAIVAQEPVLRRALVGGAVSVAIGAGVSALLVIWLRDGVGLRGALLPALLMGFLLVRLARPAIVRAAEGAASRTLVVIALTIQAAAAITAYSAEGAALAAVAFACSLAAGAFLAALITRAHRDAVPTVLAPGVALVCGAVWALAASVGAGAGASLAVGLGTGGAYLALAALAIAGAAITASPVARCRPARG